MAKIFDGYVFCVSGRLSILQHEFENLLVESGAVVKPTVTHDVTHLVCANDASSKALNAQERGVEIISESSVLQLLGRKDDEEKKSTKKRSSVVSSSPNPPLKKTKTDEDDSVSHKTDEDDSVCQMCEEGHFWRDCWYNPKNPNNRLEEYAEANDPIACTIISMETKAPNTSTTTTTTKRTITKTTTTVVAAENDIPDGGTVKIASDGPNPYVLKNVGGVFSCTCPSWRFQKGKVDERSCRHLKMFRGEAAELARIRENSPQFASLPTSKTNDTKFASKIAPAAARRAGKGALFEARNLILANKWNPDSHKATDFIMSEKLDGMRALWNGNQLVSRQGNTIHAPDFFLEGFPSGMALDGELFAGRGKFQHTVSIARRRNGGELWRQLRYVVFDAPSVDGGFENRLAAAETAVAGLEFAEIHPHVPCLDDKHLESELERVEEAGGEGLMMRKKNSQYVHGRCSELLKVKTFHDDDAIVCGYQEGHGRNKGRMGALYCRMRDGAKFKVGSGFTDAERNHPPAVGSVISFRYFEKSNSGNPRFPTFLRVRNDIDASEFD